MFCIWIGISNCDTCVTSLQLRKSCTLAAQRERLHLAQPPLSQQIRKLEELLGYPLFTRTSRSVSLTHAGEALLQRARRTLRNVQRDIDETRSIGRGDVGSLHIGFIGSAMLTTLPGIFRAYREAYPRVRLHLHESFTALVTEGLENGTLDAGILRDGDPLEGLHVTTILSEPFVAVLPATHPCAKQKSISIASLRDEPFVYYPRSAGARAYEKPLTLCEEHGFPSTNCAGSVSLAHHPAPDSRRAGSFDCPRVCSPHRISRGCVPPASRRKGGQQH